MTRSLLYIQNLSSGALYVEIGSARATCTVSGGAVTSGGFTVTNAGFNFTNPPVIKFVGGGPGGPGSGTPYLGLNQPNGPSPSNPAQAHCVLSTNTVGSIVLDNPGSGYLIAPFMLITNSDLDPYGCAVPSVGVGIELAASGGSILFNGTACPTDSVSIFGGTTSQAFCCKWMD